MAKLKADDLAIPEVLERMKESLKLSTLTQLADAMGLSHQSLAQAKQRGMISLSLLMRCVKESGGSLDFLVYGRTEVVAEVKDYLKVTRIGGGDVVFRQELLRQGVDATMLRAYVQGDKLYIINTADILVTDGTWAFGKIDRPFIRRCQLQIDGTLIVEGKALPETVKDLAKHGIIGRVIWGGAAA